MANKHEQHDEWRFFYWRCKMVPSLITTQRVSLWSVIGLFAVALFLVPTAFTVAQDYDAVIERLKQAVDAKEISPEQAKKMIAALKISSVKPAVKKNASNAKLDWDAAKKKIEGAVKAGKLTREEADAHYQALKKQTSQKPAVKKNASNDKLDWEAIKKKIEGAVKAEKLTREEADAHYLASHPGKQEPNFLTHRCTACHVKSVHTPPGTKIREVPLTQRSSQQLQIRNVNGVKDIEVTGNGRKITIHDDPKQGIKIEITDAQDGKPVTRTFQAKNAEELQKKSPEAHKLYKKHSQYAPSTR